MSKITKGNKNDILNSNGVKLSDLNLGPMVPRLNTTGSVGFNSSGKAQLDCGGTKYNFQVSFNATVSHSKPGDPKQIKGVKIEEFLTLNAHTVDMLGLGYGVAEPKEFSSGNVGYYFNGKTTVKGLSLQVGCNIIAIGSKDWGRDEVIVENEKLNAKHNELLDALL